MNTRTAEVRTLLIVSHVLHYSHGGQLHAYGPYAREIEVWADLYPDVVIAAPCRAAEPGSDCRPISRRNVRVEPQPQTGGASIAAKAVQALMLPWLALGIARAVLKADAVHVRCPGNLGLVGVIVTPLLCRRMIAKYAGEWQGFPAEPWSWRLQRWLLASRWWRGPVTVYGTAGRQVPGVVPFFPSVLSAGELQRAARAAERDSDSRRPLRVLYVGRLAAAKNVDVLLEAVAAASIPAGRLQLRVIGDGPERARLEILADTLGLTDRVHFDGSLSFEDVLGAYEDADALVLVSRTEGWGKSLTEAMAFGLLCIGSDRGAIPSILGEGRGIIVPAGDASALAAALEMVAGDPEGHAGMRRRAAEWSRGMTLERMKDELAAVMERHWRTPSGHTAGGAGVGSVSCR
jgi:glycosyltransferase involved in cell wall biosynthesis